MADESARRAGDRRHGWAGEAICIKMAALGYRVVHDTLARQHQSRRMARRAMKSQGFDFRAYGCDVADWDSAAACAQKVAGEVGPIDVLVNNAGITRDMTFKKMDKANWDAVIKTNLDSCFNMTKQVCDGMVDRSWGRIINISSVNGQKGAFGQTNYSAAKAGMHGFTKALALEVARKGVTVEHDLARLHRHEDGDGDPEGGARQQDHSADPDGPPRQAGGSGRARRVSGERGGGVPHRRQHRDQRWAAHVLTRERAPRVGGARRVGTRLIRPDMIAHAHSRARNAPEPRPSGVPPGLLLSSRARCWNGIVVELHHFESVDVVVPVREHIVGVHVTGAVNLLQARNGKTSVRRVRAGDVTLTVR